MTPAAKERRSKGEKATLKIPYGNLIIEVAGWRLFWLAVSFFALVAAIYIDFENEPDGAFGLTIKVCIVVLPIVISILLAPKQKTEDHSKLSTQAVEDLFELRRSQDSILHDLNSIDHTTLSPGDSIKITVSTQELLRESEQIVYQIGYWGEVSPDVVDNLIEKRSKRQSMLDRMEEHKRNEDKS